MRRLSSHHTWLLLSYYYRSGGPFSLPLYTSHLTCTTSTRQVSSRASAAAFYNYVHKLNASYVSHNNNNEEQTNTNLHTVHTSNSCDDTVKVDQTHLVETWHIRPSRPAHTLDHHATTTTASHTSSHKGRRKEEEDDKEGAESVIAMPASTHTLQTSTQASVNVSTSSSSSSASLYADDMRLVRQLQSRVRRHISELRRHEMCEAVCKTYDIACEVYTVLCKEIDEPIEAYMANNKKNKAASRPDIHRTMRTSLPSVSFRPCHPSLEMIVHERVGQLQRTLRSLHTTHYDVILLYETESVAQHMQQSARAHRTLHKRLRALHKASYKNYNSRNGVRKDEREDEIQVIHPLLVFTELLVGILRSLRRLPRRTAGRVTASQAETYARTCGAVHAIRDMLTALVHNDQRSIQPTYSKCCSVAEEEEQPLQRQKKKKMYARECGLRCEEVLLLFDAVLALASDDSPSFTLPVYHTHHTNTAPIMMHAQLYMSHTARPQALPSSSDNASVVMMLTMNAEEWCVRRLLSFPGLTLRIPCVQEANKETDKKEEKEEEMVTTQFGPCATDPSQTRTNTSAAERVHELTLRQAVSVVRRCMYSQLSHTNTMEEAKYNTGTHLTGNTNTTTPHVSMLRIPYGLGKAMTEWLLRELALWLPNDTNNNSPSTQTHKTMKRNAVLESIHVHDLATLCSAVLFFRCYKSVTALHVLLATAPRCVRQVEELSGPDIANMLLAYASLKYEGDIHDNHWSDDQDSNNNDVHHGEAGSNNTHHQQQQQSAQTENEEDILQNFYLVLGTRAGQLADSLSEEDVVKVLRAFEMTAIEHHTLRASLESSLRMRNVYKSPTYG